MLRCSVSAELTGTVYNCEHQQDSRMCSERLHVVHSAWHGCTHRCVSLRTPVLKNKNNLFLKLLYSGCRGWKAEVVHKGRQSIEQLRLHFIGGWGIPKCWGFNIFFLLHPSVWLYFRITCSDCDFFFFFLSVQTRQRVWKLNTLWLLSRKLAECRFSLTSMRLLDGE